MLCVVCEAIFGMLPDPSIRRIIVHFYLTPRTTCVFSLASSRVSTSFPCPRSPPHCPSSSPLPTSTPLSAPPEISKTAPRAATH
ncbi:uncharacterized protein K444DRAFT_197813 [Hyaloscypha bicolor E]|uniref:Uncharacterized protein n=1 Tax=Hyaloscypha bicolor E TaxID=1095630 RepID=A0A2J6SQL5_9HELO|nr:uncharacterized protein K444DRAFT_197813 [Hyaloscypha bicolor E]PMD53071.1 hypothetical protein K444DRAFT_197813 [Hyaloscypha bicolor E]